MSNEEILQQRWDKTEKTLKQYLKKFNALGNETIDKIIEAFDSIDITFSDLNKKISKAEKRRLDRNILEWKDKGLLTGYFEYLILSKSTYTYSDLIEIIIYSIFMEQEQKQNLLAKKVFTIVAEDIYSQAKKEIPIKNKKEFSLTWEYIWSLLWVPTYNKKWDEYLKLLTLTGEQEVFKQLLVNIQNDRPLLEKDLKPIIDKQTNRIISISNDKYSGVLTATSRQLGNKVYTDPFVYTDSFKSQKDLKDLKVRFIAEMDKRTTRMCESMNNMLFYVNDWNKFYRYSDVDKKNVLYTVKGLEQGINLPPINNHFHWCRSTITYLIDMPDVELLAEYNQMKKIIPSEVPGTLEEYSKLRYNNGNYFEELKEKEEVGIHYNKNIESGEKKKKLTFKEYYNKVMNTREYLRNVKAKDIGVISEISLHTIDRMIDRNITKEEIKEILENPTNHWYTTINNSEVFFKDKKMVAVNKENLNITTTYRGRGKKNV